MNYRLENKPGQWAPIANTDGKYVTQLYDIIESRTGYVVAKDVPAHNNEAKRLCQHLNSGGGFNGFTPEFFTHTIPPVKWNVGEKAE